MMPLSSPRQAGRAVPAASSSGKAAEYGEPAGSLSIRRIRGDRIQRGRCSIPSGIRRSRGRIGGPRGSPRRPATGRAACRRRRTPSAPRSGSRAYWRRRCRAGRARRRPVRPCPARRGPRNPIASSTRSAFSWNALSGTSCIAQRPSGPCAHSTRTHSSASTWPFAPSARLVSTAQSRSQPSSCDDEVRSFKRPVRPDQRLVLVLRRLGQDFELRDRQRALPVRGADAVRAGIAAADHDDMLARRR